MSRRAPEYRISAVVPTYNREHLIVRAIESVKRQAIEPIEIIVVDDGSDDDTRSVVSRCDGVTYVYQPNAGSCIARNTGVERASGDWIAFLDSDDTWFDDHLEKIHAAMVATSGRGNFYFQDMLRVEAAGEHSHWDRCRFSIDGPWLFAEDAGDMVLSFRQPSMLQASVVRRHAFLDAGGLIEPLRIRHDNDLFFRIGIGQPACAVAGYGTRMTSDDAPENRIFAWGTLVGPGSEEYETETVLVYTRALAATRGAETRHRRLLRRRLKGGHFTLARHAKDDGRWLDAGRHAALASASDPLETVRSLAARIVPSLKRGPVA